MPALSLAGGPPERGLGIARQIAGLIEEHGTAERDGEDASVSRDCALEGTPLVPSSLDGHPL
jgi:hypothetical protein